MGLRNLANAEGLGISDIPACGLTCLLRTVPAVGCALTNTTCQCASAPLATLTSECLLANCTMQDQLGVARVQASLCNLSHLDRSSESIAIVSSIFGVALFSVFLRLLYRYLSHTFYSEDYIIVGAMDLRMLTSVSVSTLGFGLHLWDLQDGRLFQILRLFYIAEVFYVVDLGLIKASILFMYIRVFLANQTFHRVVYGTLGFLAVSTTVISLLTIFSCRPVDFFWDKDIKTGRCLDINSLAYANSALAVVQDLLIILLPLGVLWKLSMPLKRKLLVVAMFAIGGIGLVATVIRLQTLLVFGSSIDPTSDYVPVLYWTSVELAAGIICSSLPAIRKLVGIAISHTINSVKSPSQPETLDPRSSIQLRRQYRRFSQGELQSPDAFGNRNSDPPRLA
ncbi:hypothetical protein GQ53DRAFT_665803 [Thozetella sp. PMI_491]|nr:hypothetical protein GQ53DRAFT_665803 [Thozetella sp. PMI_491]